MSFDSAGQRSITELRQLLIKSLATPTIAITSMIAPTFKHEERVNDVLVIRRDDELPLGALDLLTRVSSQNMQGRKRKREDDEQSAAKRTHENDRISRIAAQTGSQFSPWSISPNVTTNETAQPGLEAFSVSYNDTDSSARHEYPETTYRQNESPYLICHGQQDISTPNLADISTVNPAFDYSSLLSLPHSLFHTSATGTQTNAAPLVNCPTITGQFYDCDRPPIDDSSLFGHLLCDNLLNKLGSPVGEQGHCEDLSLFQDSLVASDEFSYYLGSSVAQGAAYDVYKGASHVEKSNDNMSIPPLRTETLPALYQDHGQEADSEHLQEGSKFEPIYADMTGRSRKRGRFDSKRRKETAETRKRKACLRCRVQKIRCDVNEDDVDGPCLACLCFSKVSKKTLHHVSCYRGKLTDVTLYRKGGLNLTQRWTGTEMKDVGDRINNDVRSIQVSFGICATPIGINVVRFQAAEGDVVARYWTVREGERGDEIKKKKDLEPYCLVDIWATATVFERYVVDNAIPAIVRVHSPRSMLENTFLGKDVISRTYIMAVQYYYQLDDDIESPAGKISNPQKKLLGSLFVLWLAIRSAYICGDDTLGMKPELKDATDPLFGRVSMPRMLIAQLDSINHSKLLSKYGHLVLRDLETFIFRNQSPYWWTIYLCIFILLHEASWLTSDRYRHARTEYGGKYRYSIPSFVEELQDGCNTILVHWHYYNCHSWPNPDAPWERHKHFMSELSSEQHDLVMETLTDSRIQRQLAIWKRYKEHNGTSKDEVFSTPVQPHESPYMGPQTQFDWDHPCYWISQMFEERWQPHPTYQREFAD
ncbi:hypothetical protein E4U21_006943 [Claviceps maximensis]|nr:hypothetical protein E4U21_006943 [Claviceps maximensis]